MRKLLPIILILCTLAGCGYHPVSTLGALSEGSGVNVVMFENRSYRPQIEGVLAREMVDELALRTGGKVPSASEASMTLTGSVLAYEKLPISYTSADTIREYRSVIRIEAVLKDAKTQKMIWKGQLTENQSFPVNANIALQQNAEDAAIQKICRRLSENLWQSIAQRF